MKINSININNYSLTNKQINTCTTFNAVRKRRGDVYKLKRAVIKEIESKAVYDKASELLKKLPSCKMESASICKVAGKQFGIRWNTKDSENLRLKVKDRIETSKTEEWDEAKPLQTVLDCTFDSNGVMQKGNITKKLKNGYSITAFYQRDNNNRKTIYMDGITYRQYPGNEDYWTSMPSLSSYSIKKDINLKDALSQVELAELFCELIKKNTTIK